MLKPTLVVTSLAILLSSFATAAPKKRETRAPAAATAPAPSAPTQPPLISVSGHFRFRAENNHRTDFVTDRNLYLVRVRPGVLFTPSSEVSVFLQPQFAKAFGENAYVGTSATLNTRTDTSGNVFDGDFMVHQGYADWHPNQWFKFVLGRQALQYGNEMLIGPLNWNNVSRSFDAARVQFSYKLGKTDVFASKIQDNTTAAPTTNGDKDFYGIYNAWGFGPALKEFEIYALLLQDDSLSRSMANYTGGIRLQSDIKGFDYRAEVVRQFSKIEDQTGIPKQGFNADVEFGYTFNSPWRYRIAAQGFYATKDFDQLFASFHKWLGYADILGRRNIMGGALRNTLSIGDRWEVNLDYHYFLRTDKSSPAYKLNGTTALGSATGSGSRHIGMEADLMVTYILNKQISLNGAGCVFWSGRYIVDQINVPRAYFLYASTEVKF